MNTIGIKNKTSCLILLISICVSNHALSQSLLEYRWNSSLGDAVYNSPNPFELSIPSIPTNILGNSNYQIIDFENISNGVITSPVNGVTIVGKFLNSTPGNVYVSEGPWGATVQNDKALINWPTYYSVSPATANEIKFTFSAGSTVNAVAMNFYAVDNAITLKVFDINGVELGTISTTALTGGPYNAGLHQEGYFGFKANGISYFTVTGVDGEIFGLDNLVYLLMTGPSVADTHESMITNTVALRNTLNLQSAKTAQGLTYDCTVFDVNNMCVSFAGTRSNGGDGLDNTTGALIIAHRPTANVRVGVYVDQTMGTTDSMGLKVKRGSPGYGVFGVWSQRTDGLGTQVRVAANSGKVDIETTRLAIQTAEAGFGQSNIKSNGVQLEVSQGYALNNQWTTRPYVGYRQMANKRGAYTEQLTDLVTSPLAYTGLKQTTESILAGIRFVGKLTPQTSLNLSAGIERDVKSNVDNYQASFVDGEAIDPISMTQNIKKTRPTASVGLVHSLDKTQTVGLFVTHRKEALQSGSTTSGMLQYSVGF